MNSLFVYKAHIAQMITAILNNMVQAILFSFRVVQHKMNV